MAAPNNPAGSSTPAGNTMSVPRSVSGGRTRNIINIAQPGSEGTVAYTMAWNGTNMNTAPSAATDGYANFRLQRFLHIVVDNSMGDEWEFQVWGYHSFSGKWGEIISPNQLNPGNPYTSPGDNKWKCKDGATAHIIVEIAGIERVALQSLGVGESSGGTVTAYLGVSTF